MSRREDTVRTAIIARIVVGEYRAGQPLPNRKELADEFGASQATIREALEPLVRNGTLYVLNNKGTFVARQGTPTPVSDVDAAKDIAETIKKRLTDGTYPVGTRLPNKETLASEFGVGLHAINVARKALLEAGLLITVDGCGTFSADPGAPSPRSYQTSGPGGRQITWAAPLGSTSHVQRVRDTVLARMDDHTYSPGASITAVALAEQMDVSTSTVWAALGPLVAQGRLRSRGGRGRGYVVTEVGSAAGQHRSPDGDSRCVDPSDRTTFTRGAP